jgi:hypothetical protein
VDKQEKKLTEALARAFAEEHRNILTWRKRRPLRGEPYCWFFAGRLDEYGILARDATWKYLKARMAGTDPSDDRLWAILDLAKKHLMVKS